MSQYAYVMITCARNEAKYIGPCIESVLSQTVLPKRWVIVSDGSTDSTDEIIKRYCQDNPWIMYQREPEHKAVNFAAKARCFNKAYQLLRDVDFQIVCNIDADVTFDNDYFEFVLSKFANTPELGAAGTTFLEGSEISHKHNIANYMDPPGQCLFFRRDCFEQIDGYPLIAIGGEDTIATTMARMKGWKTKTFEEKYFFHHRPMNTAENKMAKAYFLIGARDRLIGNHPLWQISRFAYQSFQRPYFMKGFCLYLGYLWAAMYKTDETVTDDVKSFRKGEQLTRLSNAFPLLLKGNRSRGR